MNRTLDYYDKNARQFAEETRNADLHKIQERFLSYLDAGARILDFGCGSGRDTRYFLEKGFQVEAVDGSGELCRLAEAYTGVPVRNMQFQELDVSDVYDGIWACASVLHLKKEQLPEVFRRLSAAARENAAVYMSFKYGSFEGERNGRYYTDFDEKSFQNFMEDFPEFRIRELWITEDARPERSKEKWLNTIFQKWTIR